MAGERHHGGLVDLGLLGHFDAQHLCGRCPRPRTDSVAGHHAGVTPCVATGRHGVDGHAGGRLGVHDEIVAIERRFGMYVAETTQRGEPPDLLQAARDRVLGEIEGSLRVQVRLHPGGLHGFGYVDRRALGGGGLDRLDHRRCGRHQPTAPSICSSISRLSSSAYSIGSSLAIGSTKPRTIIAIASSCSMPRDIR